MTASARFWREAPDAFPVTGHVRLHRTWRNHGRHDSKQPALHRNERLGARLRPAARNARFEPGTGASLGSRGEGAIGLTTAAECLSCLIPMRRVVALNRVSLIGPDPGLRDRQLPRS